MPETTVYTSIPSRLMRQIGNEEYGDTYLRECIASWKDADLRVVSVNPQFEIEQLARREIDVEYLCNGTVNERTSIGTILSLIRDAGSDVAGIINADCFLIEPGNAIGAIVKAARDSLVTLERVGLDPGTLCPTGRYCGGFDGFFFDTRFVLDIKGAGAWSIGSPQWDYWFPLVMHLAGAKLKKPDALVLLHLDHPAKWDRPEYLANALKLIRSLDGVNLDRLPPGVAQQVRAFSDRSGPSEETGEVVLETVASWLITSREQFSLCLPGGKGDFLRRVLAGIESRMTFG